MHPKLGKGWRACYTYLAAREFFAFEIDGKGGPSDER